MRLAGDPDLAAVGRVETADGVEQRRLAAARRRGQANETAILDLEIHVIEAGDLDVTLAIGLAQIRCSVPYS